MKKVYIVVEAGLVQAVYADEPDIEVELPEEWQNKNLFLLPAEEDTQLHKAVEVLASAD